MIISFIHQVLLSICFFALLELKSDSKAYILNFYFLNYFNFVVLIFMYHNGLETHSKSPAQLPAMVTQVT